MIRGTADAQIMRMCADNAPSACIMHGCVFCADNAQMRMVRMVRMVRMCGAAQRVQMRSMGICDVRCCAECAEAEPIAREPKTHHFPSYSRAGGRNQQKSMIFEQPQRRSVLHESREPYPCHTFRNDAADFFTPSCNFEATHAQRCNSCRSGAWPTMPNPSPCRPHRREKAPQAPAIITIGADIGLVRLQNTHASQPHARATATPEKKQRNRIIFGLYVGDDPGPCPNIL